MKKSVLQTLKLPSQLVEKIYGEEESLENLFIFTGRGISNEPHMGHYAIYSFLSALSHRFKVFFQISNDEKRSSSSYMHLDQVTRKTEMFKKFIFRFDWHKENTVFFDNMGLDRKVLEQAAQYLNSKVKIRQLQSILGDSHCPYLYYYLFLQMAPLVLLKFLDATPVIVTADDQEAIFLFYRDLCHKFNLKKPIIIVVKPLLDLYLKEKMSSSEPKSALTMNRNSFPKLKKAISGTEDFCTYLLNYLSQIGVKIALNPKDYKNHSYQLKRRIYDQIIIPFLKKPFVKYPYGLKAYINKEQRDILSTPKSISEYLKRQN